MAEQQRYRVVRRLAAGGMAEVFVAESAGIEGFKKRVAIKRVLPQLSRKDQFIAMFLDEARLSAQLSHSNVVSVFDIGVGDGSYFIVMEYVEGADLKAVMDHWREIQAPIPVEQAVFIATKICQGLAYAHELTNADGKPLEIIHRDVTPANVLITKYGEVKIVDFGLAKASSQLAASEQGVIKGKFGYLAPETVLEQPVDHRVDVFAVGIILWEMLAGRRLFQGRTDYETVRQVMQTVIPPIRDINPDVPPELEPILLRGLARNQNDRYYTAREFGRDLTAFLYWWGRSASEYEVADLVRAAMGIETAQLDTTQKIAEMIDLMLLEFKSLAADDEAAPVSAYQPESMGMSSFEQESAGADEPLGNLADLLEGTETDDSALEMEPEPQPQPEEEEQPQQKGWFRSLLQR
jgi:serine/threonine-protein kinase